MMKRGLRRSIPEQTSSTRDFSGNRAYKDDTIALDQIRFRALKHVPSVLEDDFVLPVQTNGIRGVQTDIHRRADDIDHTIDAATKTGSGGSEGCLEFVCMGNIRGLRKSSEFRSGGRGSTFVQVHSVNTRTRLGQGSEALLPNPLARAKRYEIAVMQVQKVGVAGDAPPAPGEGDTILSPR